MRTVRDILNALDILSGGRCVTDLSELSTGKNNWVVIKSSRIPGKDCMEIPGLVWGDPQKIVRKVAVCMTLTESVIELAGATSVDAIISHHPSCDAANSGGVLLSSYLNLYGLAYFEIHEAFHGLHPGIPWLHGHMPIFTSVNYGGIVGNVVNVGNVLDDVKTIGDLIIRLNTFMDFNIDYQMLEAERTLNECNSIEGSAIAARTKILVGNSTTPIQQIIHIHPHCGFTPAHLKQLKKDFPKADTVIASISHVKPDHELVATAKELGLNFLCGNSHALEIFENGVPLAYALRRQMPDLEMVLYRERQTSIPLDAIGSPYLRAYGKNVADYYLPKGDLY